MTTITNDFHNTAASIKAQVGDKVTVDTAQRVQKELCGIADCSCSGPSGERGSKYGLEPVYVRGEVAEFVVVDNQARNRTQT